MASVQDSSGLIVGSTQTPNHDGPQIIDYRHPEFTRLSLHWAKWRLVFAGGDDFSEEFLEKYSTREDTLSFNMRRRITPSPSFAKAAVTDIKNSIFQRMNDITRAGGSKDYQSAVSGQNNGVDNHGASMNSFIGRYVLPELLAMAKVGVFVDMPENVGDTMLSAKGAKPYLYLYRTEQILSWTYRWDKPDEFASILLVDYLDQADENTSLPLGIWTRYRHIWIDDSDGKVHVQYYNVDCEFIDRDGQAGEGEYILDLDFIPFMVFELSDSLLSDVANHQIALLNLESSDIMYALKSNFPFYVEERDNTIVSDYLKKNGDGTQAGSGSQNNEITVGAMQGRAYGKGLHAPEFISPSSEPLQASMAKQEQLKADIRQLVNLAVANIKPKMASAESKSIDEHGLESGLAYIGLELEHGERKIARYWALYENKANPSVATISYPAKYALQSDADKQTAVQNLEKIRDSVFSPTFRKAISKQIARLLLDGLVDQDTLSKINKEIDDGVAIVADPALTLQACEQGICSLDVAEKIFGYPKGTADKASTDHIERLARIASTQGLAAVSQGTRGVAVTENPAARGVPDLGTPGSGKQEKKIDQTTNPSPGDPTRGVGK